MLIQTCMTFFIYVKHKRRYLKNTSVLYFFFFFFYVFIFGPYNKSQNGLMLFGHSDCFVFHRKKNAIQVLNDDTLMTVPLNSVQFAA